MAKGVENVQNQDWANILNLYSEGQQQEQKLGKVLVESELED